MTIGLTLLAIVAILIFFGVIERFFRGLGLSNALAFIFVIALVIGAVVPSINIGTAFSLNIGGFLVPIVIMMALMIIMRFSIELAKTFIAILSVAAIAVATRMLIEPQSTGLVLASSLIVGFAGGIVAFLVGQSRLATLASAMGGIILGDVITNFLYVYGLGGFTFSLGSYGVFDSVVIASIFGILLFEAVAAIKGTALRQQKKARVTKSGLTPALEAAEDNDIQQAVKEEEAKLLSEAKQEETDTFFDEYV